MNKSIVGDGAGESSNDSINTRLRRDLLNKIDHRNILRSEYGNFQKAPQHDAVRSREFSVVVSVF